MATSNLIETNWDGAICQVKINRPQKANSLTSEMLEMLIESCRAARSGAKALILGGTGKVFSAGADLEQAANGLATSHLWEELSGEIAGLDCLTIASLNGTLAGGAFGMALACDIRISVPKANFFYPVMKLGYLPQPSDPGRLRELVGPSRAKMILMGGQKIDSQTALAWGLIDEIVESDNLSERVLELCDASLSATTEHIGAIKNLIG